MLAFYYTWSPNIVQYFEALYQFFFIIIFFFLYQIKLLALFRVSIVSEHHRGDFFPGKYKSKLFQELYFVDIFALHIMAFLFQSSRECAFFCIPSHFNIWINIELHD